MKVAFIGIGNMGKPMAANVVRGGHEVLLFDSNPEAAARAAQEIGATSVENLAGAATAELVVTMLPDGKVVREVLLGSRGFGKIAPAGIDRRGYEFQPAHDHSGNRRSARRRRHQPD